MVFCGCSGCAAELKQLLHDIRQISGEFFVVQHDRAPARTTINLLHNVASWRPIFEILSLQTQQLICNKPVVKDPTVSQTHRCNAL